MTKTCFTMETYEQMTTVGCNEKSKIRSCLSTPSGRNMTSQTKNNSRDLKKKKTLVLFAGNIYHKVAEISPQSFIHEQCSSVPPFII